MLPHLIRSLRALMPQAVFSDHHGVLLAKLENETFLISNLSLWSRIKAINAANPFPAGVTPLLFCDTYDLSCVPRGDWLIAGLHGIKSADGHRLGNLVKKIEDIPSIQCPNPDCPECRMGVAYSVPGREPEKNL